MEHYYLFCIKEIEEIILSHLNTPIDFFQLMLINKYFCKNVNDNIIFSEFKNFSCTRLEVYRICTKLNEKFLKACQYNYPHAAKYLLEKYTDKINIHIENEYAFRWSCSNDHLEIAKWLYSLDHKINIHVYCDEAFKQSCKNGRVKVALWLASICDKYKLTIIDNKIVDFHF